jgi:hypothetical protein
VANSVGALAGALVVLLLGALWSLLRRSRRRPGRVS